MPRRLLVADDSETIQKVIKMALADLDVAITAVDNGEDAVRRARELQPDLIIADVVMPRKNGYEVCEQIKQDPALQTIPVLLLTGTFEPFDEKEGSRVGADGHIAKPFEAKRLVQKVSELLGEPALAAEPEPVMPGLEATGLGGAGAPEDEEEILDLSGFELSEPVRGPLAPPAPAPSSEPPAAREPIEVPITLGEEPLGEFRFDIEFEPTGHQGAGGAAAGGTEELTFGVEPLEAFEPAPEGGPGMELTAPEAPSLSLGEIPFELPPLEPQGGEQPALHEEWLMAAPEPGPPAAGVREAARPTRPAPEAGEVAEVSETISLELRGVSRARFEELMARAVREAVEEVIRDVVPRLAREILQEELKRGRQP